MAELKVRSKLELQTERTHFAAGAHPHKHAQASLLHALKEKRHALKHMWKPVLKHGLPVGPTLGAASAVGAAHRHHSGLMGGPASLAPNMDHAMLPGPHHRRLTSHSKAVTIVESVPLAGLQETETVKVHAHGHLRLKRAHAAAAAAAAVPVVVPVQAAVVPVVVPVAERTAVVSSGAALLAAGAATVAPGHVVLPMAAVAAPLLPLPGSATLMAGAASPTAATLQVQASNTR
jgi:hypothetical protein